MIADFLNFLADGVFGFLEGFFGLLPQMPISADDIGDMITGSQIVTTSLGWVNYFLPLDMAASMVALWCTAMMAYIGLKLAIKYSEKIV